MSRGFWRRRRADELAAAEDAVIVDRFDDADRLLRGECDPDIADLYARALVAETNERFAAIVTREWPDIDL